MIRAVPNGVEIEVRVVPRAAKAGVAGVRAGAVQVRLNAPPVEGAANRELIEVIADVLGVPKRAVSLVSGERSRVKRLRIDGIDLDSASARLFAP